MHALGPRRYQRLLGLAEAGWLPVALRDYSDVSYDRVPLDDIRSRGWHVDQEDADPAATPSGETILKVSIAAEFGLAQCPVVPRLE